MKILFVVYDNESRISVFPHGIAYIAALCREKGHEVSIYSQDVYHWPDSHLTDYLDKERFDVVGVGACGGYYQYNKILKISDAINRSRQRPAYWIGGHLVSPEPEFFLRKTGADVIVIGEGEETVLELLSAKESNKSLAGIKGIAFKDGDKFTQTPRRPTIKNIDRLPFPAWDLFPMEHYVLARLPNANPADRFMSVLSSRGCTFKCNFCYRMDKGYRPRSAANVLEEIAMLKKKYNITFIGFIDELLMGSTERTIDICNSLMRSKLNIRWTCSGRLNYAKPQVLRLMKKAGCVFINYGIESLDEKVLRLMNKALTVEQIITGIENTEKSGISAGLNIIFGNIGDNRKTLKKAVKFLLRYDDGAQMRTIRPVTPYPGSALYYYAIEKGMLKDCGDFYRKHVNSDLMSVNFTEMDSKEFHESLLEANTTLLTNYFNKNLNKMIKESEELYLNKNASFRGYRQI